LFTLQQLQSGLITTESLGPQKRFKLAQGLTEFPRELFDLAEYIEVLDLGGNQLSDLPDDFHRFKNLKILFLTDNVFEHVPSVLAQCEKLEMIAFKSNRVKTVAEDCLPLSTNWLILTNNQIEALPNSIGQLTKLRKLALAGNRLTSLPDSMANCEALELVRLSANQLTTLPDWLLSLPKLAWLGFSGNPVCKTPNNIEASIPQVSLNSIVLNHQIGEGASGIIYHANWQGVENDGEPSIAVKVFKGSVTSDGYPKDEIQCCLKTGEHPNLIRVLSHINDSDSEKLGLVMELISSDYKNLGLPPSLKSCTRDTFESNTILTSQDVLKITHQMADILLHMHQQGVSHGDIYAHNTMYDSHNNVLFGDFGAATNLDRLSVEQRTKMQLIEVRAFGCFMDDLLSLVQKKDTLSKALTKISQSAMVEELTDRSDFIRLESELNKLKSNT
jgi:tRNA A-37 threonylcarbamoyl transferase component Bud32